MEGLEEVPLQALRPLALAGALALVLCPVLALAAAGCRGSAASVSGSGGGQDTQAPVAVVGGQPISKATLSDWFFERYPEEYGRTLGALVDERLAIAEARREGVRVPRVALEKAVAREVKARRKQLRDAYGPDVDLAAQVRRAYGVDVATWRDRILAPRLHAHLLMQRVIRWDTRRRPRLHVRVIVLADRARAQAVAAKVAAGADFSLTAAKESLDPSGKRGGDLPWIARGDLAYPGVEKRLFAARPGNVVGPLEVRVDGRVQYQIYKVIEAEAAWTGSMDDSWQRLEDDLLAHPVDAGEFERWRARSHRDAQVRYFRPDGRVWVPPSRR